MEIIQLNNLELIESGLIEIIASVNFSSSKDKLREAKKIISEVLNKEFNE